MKNLDQFFKNKIQNRKFEFQEAYWDDAKKLIDGDKKRRRRGGWLPWFLGLALVTVLSVGIYWLVVKSNSSRDLEASATSSAIVSEILKSEEGRGEEEKENSSMASNTKTNNKNLSQNSGTNSSRDFEASSNFSGSTGTNTILKSGFTSKNIDNISNTNLQDIDTPESKNAIAILADTEEKKEEEDLIPRILMSPFDQMSLKTFERILIPGAPWSIECDFKPNPKNKKWNFGWSIYSLLNSQKGEDYFWVGGATGPGIQYRLNKRLSLQSDLLYRWRRGHFSPKEESKATTYSFGRTTETFRLNASEVHQIDWPIYLQFRNRRQMIEGGISVQFNLGLRGDLISEKSLFPWERKQVGAAPANKTETSLVDTGWIQDANIRKVQFGLLLGYRYQLNRKINAGLQVRYDLNSIYKEMPLDGKGKLDGSPLHFQIGISYYPFK